MLTHAISICVGVCVRTHVFLCVFEWMFVCVGGASLYTHTHTTVGVVRNDPIFITHQFKGGGEALPCSSDKCITPINPVSTEVLSRETHKHCCEGESGSDEKRRGMTTKK